MDYYFFPPAIWMFFLNSSEKRGEEIKKRLISSGIPENQITIQSLGESSPVVDCTDCSEKEHAENRVVILSIKKRDQKDAL